MSRKLRLAPLFLPLLVASAAVAPGCDEEADDCECTPHDCDGAD
jgi:hypothetical protein